MVTLPSAKWGFLLVGGLVVAAAVAGTQRGETEYEPEWVDARPPNVPDELFASDQFQRFWWSFTLRAGLNGTLPEGAIDAALAQIADENGIQAAQPEILNMRFAAIGPSPIAGGQIGSTGGTRVMSGRVTALAADPTNEGHWYIGGAQGGVWETKNAGQSWVAKSDAEAALAIGALAVAPSSPNIVYAGTGEPSFSGDSYGGHGLLRSVDGGLNWVRLGQPAFEGLSFANLLVDPTDAGTLVGATNSGGIFGRDGTFTPALPPRGIFRSTDGGATSSLRLAGDATDVKADPTNFDNQLAGIGNVSGAVGNGLYRSTNGGQTWVLVPATPWASDARGLGRMQIAIAPSNPNRVFVSIQDAFNGNGLDGALLGLFYSSNAWAAVPTWTQISTAPTDGSTGNGFCGYDFAFRAVSRQCWYDQVIVADPVDPDLVFAGGIPFWSYNVAASVWTEVSHTTPASATLNGIHADQHAAIFVGNRLLVGNDGGVWSSTDRGATWNDHNTNLALTQFYDGSVHPGGGALFLGGAQDNGTTRGSGTPSWPLVNGGDGADNAISAINPLTYWAVSSQGLVIRRTINGGSFTARDNGIEKTNAPFIARFEKCPGATPSTDDVFIAGTDNVWRVNDFFTGNTPWVDNLSGNFSSGITALAFARNLSCSTYAFGSRAGGLRITANGGATWVDWDLLNLVPNRAINGIAFDPSNANVAYVAVGGFDQATPTQPGHVFKTTNALAAAPTWVSVTYPVNIPANTVVVDPANPAVVYVGTDLGIQRSADGGGNWAHMGPAIGMPNVAVLELQMPVAQRLVAFTHGRSAFALASFDLNADGVTNCTDVGLIRGGMGKKFGQVGYSNALDLNSDGIIDIRDLALETKQLPTGTSCQ